MSLTSKQFSENSLKLLRVSSSTLYFFFETFVIVDQQKTDWCRKQLADLSLRKLAKKVQVTWNSRMRSTAGRAFWPSGEIQLNPKLREISENEVDHTLRHELAHIIAYEIYGRKIKPHGPEWRATCHQLEIPDASVTHNLPLKKRTLRKNFCYTCPSCGIGFQRVRKIKRAAACLSCCRKFNHGKFHTSFAFKETHVSLTE